MGLLPQPSDLLLFPQPAALARLLVASPDATVEDYTRVVGGDPALALQVLRLANSAVTRGIEPVVSVRGAVVRLGTDTTRRAVTVMAVRSVFGSFADAGLETHDLWWHLLGTGLLAEAMAPDRADGSAAFTAGLLHDLGRLSLATLDPARYRNVVARVRAGQDPLRAEREEFGLSHVSWGDQLAHHWRLPHVLTEAIARHHDGTHGLAALIVRAREALDGLGFADGLAAHEEPATPSEDGAEESATVSPLVALVGGRDGLMARLVRFGEAG